jgi:hypothetical protein
MNFEKYNAFIDEQKIFLKILNQISNGNGLILNGLEGYWFRMVAFT